MTRILLEHFLTYWREWRPEITVLTRLGYGLPPGSVNLKSSYISALLWIKRFAQNFIKHKASGKVILPLGNHRAYCSSPLLLQTAAENNNTTIRLSSHYTHTLHPLDKCSFGPLKTCKGLSYHSISHGACLKYSCFRGYWCKCLWINRYSSFEPQQNACSPFLIPAKL